MLTALKEDLPGTGTSDSVTTTVSITNQLDVAIDVYDEFNPGTDTNALPLLYTPLEKIQPGATAEVKTIRDVSLLVAAVTGTIAELNGNFYHQFPVKAMSGTPLSFDPQPLAYTVTAADRTAAILSFQFHKYISANPDQALSKGFTAALQNGFAAVNAYLKTTKNFSQCTMASWHLVMSWLQNGTSGWQGPYYLYEAPASPVPADYVPALVAVLNVKSDAGADSAEVTLCTAGDDGKPVFDQASQKTTVVMAGDGTLQNDDPGVGMPVSLTPVWMNVVVPAPAGGTPRYLIGQAVTGTVGNASVVSSQTPRPKPSDASGATGGEGGSDKEFIKFVEIVGLLAGLAGVIDFAAKIYKKVREKLEQSRKKKNVDPEKEESDIDAESKSELADPKNPALDPANQGKAEQVGKSYREVAAKARADAEIKAAREGLTAVEEDLRARAENGDAPTQTLEDSLTEARKNLATREASIAKGDFTTGKAEFQQSLDTMSKAATAETASTAKAVAECQEKVSKAAAATEEFERAAEERETRAREAASDSDVPPEDLEEPPVEEIDLR